LKNVKGLHIIDRFNWVEEHRTREQEYYDTLEILLPIPVALTSFTLKGSVNYNTDMIEKIVVALIHKHKDTLQRLDLEHVVWESKNMETIVLPNLKELSLSAVGFLLPRVCTFINKQSPLKSLELKFKRAVTSGQPLLETLRKRGPPLAKISLDWRLESKANRMEDEDEVANPAQEAPMDFSFLKSFGSLRALKIRQAHAKGTERRATPGTIFCLSFLVSFTLNEPLLHSVNFSTLIKSTCFCLR